jgi:hypothetical protein
MSKMKIYILDQARGRFYAISIKDYMTEESLLQLYHLKLPYISFLELVRISGCLKKKQEVSFDLLCLWVLPTEKSYNQDILIKRNY